MNVTSQVKKVAEIILAIIAVCLGAILLYKALRWSMLLFELHQLTGPICNFIMLRVIGMLFTFEGYIERKYMVDEADIMPLVMGILFWLGSTGIFGYFVFTEQRTNFIALYFLISLGLVMVYFPRLLKAYQHQQ